MRRIVTDGRAAGGTAVDQDARLRELGLVPAQVGPDGFLRLPADGPLLHKLVAAAPSFREQVRRRWTELGQGGDSAVEIWADVFLVPLPTGRRRVLRDGQAQPITAVLLVGEAFLDSDQCRLICDQAQRDLQLTLRQVDRQTLVGAREVPRLARMISLLQRDTAHMDRQAGELRSMGRQLGETYEELSLLYKLSANMTLSQNPAQFLADACRELQEVLNLRWLALQLAEDDPRLNSLRGQLFATRELDGDAGLVRQVGRDLMGLMPQDGQPLVIDDTRSFGVAPLARLARHALAIALHCEDRLIGVLFGGDKLDGAAISTVDSKLCSALANSLSIFLHNFMLYDDAQAMFVGTLTALTAAIDAKDRYTRGHSERVALLARSLAEAVGLPAEVAERVYLAGLVHDIGKIGVPEQVLYKPGQLTPEEFALIKQHPEIGAHILQDIRQMQDLVPGVLYHHERWDGHGYPFGRAEQDIPLLGRLIALADAFDAMSSNRTYRRAIHHAEVLAEIRHCAGRQFDPGLAAVFVELDFQPFTRLLEKHQMTDQQPLWQRAAS